ncbi:MAG: hypothetical protein AAGB04_23245 [Pseudomonadota bacterium]
MVAKETDRTALEKALLEAHAQGDGKLLAELYEWAADISEADGDIEAASFYLTHALVFALQEGLESSKVLRARLHEYGREDL